MGNNCVRLRDSLWFPSEKCNKFLINARFHSTIEFIVRIPIEFDSWFEHFNINSSTIVDYRRLGRGYDPRVCDWDKLNGISFESVTPTTKEPTLGRTTLSLVFDKLNTVVQITPSNLNLFFHFHSIVCVEDWSRPGELKVLYSFKLWNLHVKNGICCKLQLFTAAQQI